MISKLKKKYKILKPIHCTCLRPKVKNNGVSDEKNQKIIVEYKTKELAQRERVIIEDFLDGKFRKWNSNSGWFGEENISIQAFCHWTYHYTDGKLLFCDAQGIRTKNEYILTDRPCILSWKGGKYGSADCGKDYIITWFEQHKCNKFCKSK